MRDLVYLISQIKKHDLIEHSDTHHDRKSDAADRVGKQHLCTNRPQQPAQIAWMPDVPACFERECKWISKQSKACFYSACVTSCKKSRTVTYGSPINAPCHQHVLRAFVGLDEVREVAACGDLREWRVLCDSVTAAADILRWGE